MPNLSELVTEATNFKLRPNFNGIKEDPVDLWFNTRDVLVTVLIYYLERFLGIKVSDYVHSQEIILKAMRDKYFQERIGTLTGINNNLKINLLSLLLQIYFNYKYFLNMCRWYGPPSFRLLFNPLSVILKVYITSIPVLLSLKRNGNINHKCFMHAKTNLLSISPNYLDISTWNDLRHVYLLTYKHEFYEGPR
jgi:hypothetical protein